MNIKWAGNKINEDANHRLVTDTEKQTWNGKANANHTHTKSQISDFPESLKNPYNFVIQLNGGITEGSNMFTYNGSVSKAFNITASSIGAATSEHTHNILTCTDTRNAETKPDDYKSKMTFVGLKQNSTIGKPSSDIFSYVLGLRGWSDNTGGGSHELAFNNIGIFRRVEKIDNSTNTSSWGSWLPLLDSAMLVIMQPLKHIRI